MKIITSVTVFQDAVGLRMSATYSEVNDTTGRIEKDNQRFDRVVTDQGVKADAEAIMAYATESLEAQ